MCDVLHNSRKLVFVFVRQGYNKHIHCAEQHCNQVHVRAVRSIFNSVCFLQGGMNRVFCTTCAHLHSFAR